MKAVKDWVKLTIPLRFLAVESYEPTSVCVAAHAPFPSSPLAHG